MTSGIYAILNVSTSIYYVGSAVDLKNRWRQHKQELIWNKHRNSYLQHAYNKYGKLSFIFVVLELVDDKTKLIEREQYWIDETECCNRAKGYNLSPKAGSNLGIKHSEETRKRMSVAQKGKPKPALALALTGKKHSEETKRKMSVARTGLKRSPEARLRMSIAQKGLKKPMSMRLSKRKFNKWPCVEGCKCQCNECEIRRFKYYGKSKRPSDYIECR